MKAAARLAALEQAQGGGLTLHCPEDSDDHAASWCSVLAKRPKQLGIVHFPGINDEAVAAFSTAKPAGIL